MQQLSVRLLVLLHLGVLFCILKSAVGEVQADNYAGDNQRPVRASRYSRMTSPLLSRIRGERQRTMPERGLIRPSVLRQRHRQMRRDEQPAMAEAMRPAAPAMAEMPTRDAHFSGMRYWEKGLAKASPTPLPPTDRFISFEPWMGGFNNIRMSLEIAMALALATNRTLVLPNEYNMYKLPGVNAWSDFFDLENMARGVPIMHQKEFQAKFGLPNRNGQTKFPKAASRVTSNPEEHFVRKGWQGIWEISRMYGVGEDELKAGDLAVGAIYCVPDCPTKPGDEFYDEFQVYRRGRMPFVSTSSWDVAPDDKPDYKNIVHFHVNGLGHWYNSIFIRPKALDVQHKEAMKNHCHFNDHIFGFAERVLQKLLKSTPSFSCTHVRRGDFQFKDVWTPVNETMSNIERLFQPGEHMWVMTEEKDPHGFFSEMKATYNVHFLKDYMELLHDAKPSLFPMIETVICSRARVFSGTFKSSLTGYVHRLRGYMDDVENKNIYFNQVKYPDGYGEDWGIGTGTKYPTWIHARGVRPGTRVPAWAREYREAWDSEWNMMQHELEMPPIKMPRRQMRRDEQPAMATEVMRPAAPAMAEMPTRHADFSGMRYWEKGLARASPTPLPPTDRFVSFEPWQGGFNNIRMSLEIAMALALATNRTLVLPDEYNMYKLPGVNAWSDFFDLEDMARGVPIMHQKEFQAKFGLPNRNGQTEFPKAARRVKSQHYVRKGWQGIWEISRMYGVGEDELKGDLAVGAIYCVPDCPTKPGDEFYDEFQVYRRGRMPFVSTSSWDVAPPDKPDYKNIVHFHVNGLGHWYNSIFIRPKALDVQHKEAMKNHCHFNDHIFGFAERVLQKLLKSTPSFSCTHVRRGDFQFKDVWTPVNETMSNIERLFQPGEHMWVMTEEKDPHGFFSEMKATYNVHFLKDYMELLHDAKPSLFPMIETVICSRARVFSGTFKSSLTGYVHRLRGYMDDVENKNIYFNQVKYPDGYGEDWGIGTGTKYPTWIHARGVRPGTRVPAWAREFREAWDSEWNMMQHELEMPPIQMPRKRRNP